MRSNSAPCLSLVIVLVAFASGARADGDGRPIGFRPSLHFGGSVGGGFGRIQSQSARTLFGQGYLELRHDDFFAFGLVGGVTRLPTLPTPLGERAYYLSLRLRIRMPLVPGERLHRNLVPLLSFGIEGGPGGLTGPPDGTHRRIGTLGGAATFEVVIAGRLTPFVSVGYRRFFMPGDSLRQLEVRSGIALRFAGPTHIGPRELGDRPFARLEVR
jgi:hypothetical protein